MEKAGVRVSHLPFLFAPETKRGPALLIYAYFLCLCVIADKIQRVGIVVIDLHGDVDMIGVT